AERACVAILARRASRQRSRQVRDASGDDPATPVEQVLEAARDERLPAVERHRRLELAIRKLRQPFARAGDAREALDVVVPRCEIRVANRPVRADAVARVRLEIEVAQAIALPAPEQRAAADLVRAE